MTRIMRDSTTAADIPAAGADIIAGYGNGRYAWSKEDWARFPHAQHARIDVNGSDADGCSILDVETGDATPAQAPGWIRRRHALHGGRATVYCNRATMPAVVQHCKADGLVLGADWVLWVATGDGTKTLPDMHGVVAVQDRWQNLTGGHWDESIVYDDHWHAPAPKPAPAPAPPPAERTYIVVELPGGTAFKAVSGTVLK